MCGKNGLNQHKVPGVASDCTENLQLTAGPRMQEMDVKDEPAEGRVASLRVGFLHPWHRGWQIVGPSFDWHPFCSIQVARRRHHERSFGQALGTKGR